LLVNWILPTSFGGLNYFKLYAVSAVLREKKRKKMLINYMNTFVEVAAKKEIGKLW
jgi:hypothetical protein